MLYNISECDITYHICYYITRYIGTMLYTMLFSRFTRFLGSYITFFLLNSMLNIMLYSEGGIYYSYLSCYVCAYIVKVVCTALFIMACNMLY